jgi:inorganic pyrophosphatase
MELTDQLLSEYKALIGRAVTVTMDRPIGTAHPKHPEIIYPINYGYIDGLLGGDGEEQDVYVFGKTTPLDTFDGVVIAVVHRYDDDECKWVASDGTAYTKEQIERAVHFQEQFHQSEIIV